MDRPISTMRLTQQQSVHGATRWALRWVLCTATLLLSALVTTEVWAQAAPSGGSSVSGVRSFDGGVGPLFSLVGPGNLYLDGSGTQGYIYNFGSFQTFNFRTPGGQAWSGAQGLLGPQLSIGLIQGANQVGAPVVLPPPPRSVVPPPAVQSTVLDIEDFP
ncbi:MAG TPA: hypothetical protein VLA99_16925 [Nitrospiraceae bacterium]|nr:hypothetical protein [Nitrospiraceae bacterium]